MAPFELVVQGRIPNLVVRNLPPAAPFANKSPLYGGSPLARQRELIVRLRRQMFLVVAALRKTQERYNCSFDHQLATRKVDGKIGDYVYTTNNDRKNKVQRKVIDLFLVQRADACTFVMDIHGEEKRVSSDHVTRAQGPTRTHTVPHRQLGNLDKPKDPPATPHYTAGRYFIAEKLLNLPDWKSITRTRERVF